MKKIYKLQLLSLCFFLSVLWSEDYFIITNAPQSISIALSKAAETGLLEDKKIRKLTIEEQKNCIENNNCLDKIISEKPLKTIELQCYLHQVSLGSCKCKQKQACGVKLNTLRLRSIHPLVSVLDLNFRLCTQTKSKTLTTDQECTLKFFNMFYQRWQNSDFQGDFHFSVLKFS